MSLSEKLAEDLQTALKAGDTVRRTTIGMLRSTIHNKEIEKGKKDEGLSDEEIIGLLMAESKKRREAMEEYKRAGRSEQAAQEEAELAIIQSYLPAQLSDTEIASELRAILDELGTRHKADFGRIMKVATERMRGRTEGSRIKSELDKLLS